MFLRSFPVILVIVIVNLTSLVNGRDIFRIINGYDAPEESAKFQVWVRQWNTKTNYRMCGGILVSPTKVITAAHCLIPGNPKVSIRYGTHDVDKPHKPDIFAADFVIHPLWHSMNHEFDIAVITLSESIQEDSHVKFAQIETGSIPNMAQMEIYGWGYTSMTMKILPTKLQYTKIVTENCSSSLPKSVCARSWNSVACHGDSGSSLVYQGKAVGVLSAVSSGCLIGGLNIYTRIADHMNFVRKHL